MSRYYIILSTLALFGLTLLSAQLIYACDARANVYMANDASGQVSDGPYDPCDDYINWSMSFYRTGQSGGTATIIDWRLLNSSGGQIIRHEFSSASYAPTTWWYPQGTDYVGPSTSHTLVMRRYSGPTGRFETISLQVDYVAGDANRQGN